MDHPLRLAVGSHQAGSGKGCAMNVISWENGDSTITDLPACSDPMLARMVQGVNDTICTHRDGDLLCPACSQKVLALGHRTVGTGGLLPADEIRKVWVRVACHVARMVAHLNPDPRVMAAIEAAEGWADGRVPVGGVCKARATAYTAYTAAAATTASAAATATAAAAATAATTATTAYAAATTAYAAATTASTATAYTAADLRLSRYDIVSAAIDKFCELTGFQPEQTPPEVTAAAYEKLLVRS